jgi:capsular polysaccharide biosynthesis protein
LSARFQLYQRARLDLIHSIKHRRERVSLSEQMFDARGVLRVLREHRVLLAALTLLGAGAAVVTMVLLPPSYTATSLVLIPGSSNAPTTPGAPSSNGTSTDCAIATSASLLVPALAKVHPRLSLAEAKQRVRAVSTATNIVQISADGTTAHQADSLANAVAGQLVTFVTSSGGAAGTEELAGPDLQATQLSTEITSLNRQIQSITLTLARGGLSSSARQRDGALLASLTASKSNATLELANVNSEIASAKLNAGIANVGTEIIQRATIASAPSLVDRALLDRGFQVTIGAAIGLALGVVIALRRRRDQRLISRDEIAEAVGVPVVLSFTVGRWRSSSNWLEMLQDHQLGTVERWNVQKAIRALGLAGGKPSHLTVVSLIGDAPSMAAMCWVAIASASSGTQTSLVVTSDDESSVGLCNAVNVLSARSESARPNLRVVKHEPQSHRAAGGAAALTITSVVVDPERPTLPADIAAGTVVLAICSRAATAQQITQVLIFLGEEGLSVNGVFVTNPPDYDETTGRRLQPLHVDDVVRLRTMHA